jgi:hypothetical protein
MATPESIGLIALVVLCVILLVLVSVALRLIEMRSRMGGVQSRVEAKLDLLLKQIKLYMQSTGVGLKEANEFIKEFQRRSGIE